MTDYNQTPPPHENTYVRKGGGSAPWVIAAIVAVVAIIAVAFLMSGRTDPSQDEIASAMDASRAAGYVEGATASVASGAQAAADRTASEAADAAADARAAAESAAMSAGDAARDASDRVEDETATITTPVQ